MIDPILEMLGIIGLELAQPETLGELIPELLKVFVAIGMLLAIIKLFKFIISLVMGKPRML